MRSHRFAVQRRSSETTRGRVRTLRQRAQQRSCRHRYRPSIPLSIRQPSATCTLSPSPPLIARRSSYVLASPSSMIGSNALTLMLANVAKCITSEWRARSTLCMRRACVGAARNKVRSDSGVRMWMSYSPSGSVRGTNSRLGSRGTWTYAKARWAM